MHTQSPIVIIFMCNGKCDHAIFPLFSGVSTLGRQKNELLKMFKFRVRYAPNALFHIIVSMKMNKSCNVSHVIVY